MSSVLTEQALYSLTLGLSPLYIQVLSCWLNVGIGSQSSPHPTPAKQLISVLNLLHRMQSVQVLFCVILSILCARELTTSQHCSCTSFGCW